MTMSERAFTKNNAIQIPVILSHPPVLIITTTKHLVCACKVNKYWVCSCFQKMALKKVTRKKCFPKYQTPTLRRGNKNGKHIGSLAKKLMKCSKVSTSWQSCPTMSMIGALLPSALEHVLQPAVSPVNCLASVSGL